MASFSRSPYSLYKKVSRSGRVLWYVRFWNPEEKKYSITRSTGVEAIGKRERRAYADKAARAMLADIKFKPTSAKELFTDYVESFWTLESPYVVDCATVNKKPLSAYYVKMNHDDVARHIRPFPGFKGKKLNDITTGNLKAWRRWALARGLSARRVNTITQSMRVATRYAVGCGDIQSDPFHKLGEVKYDPKEKGILSPQEVTALVNLEGHDPRIKAVILLGVLAGLRRGEIRGLRWGAVDLDNGLIHVSNNYVSSEGDKAPKRDSVRDVPIIGSLKKAIEAVGAISGMDAGDYVFPSLERGKESVPISENFFRAGLRTTLAAIGIDDDMQRSRNITLHGLRHTFVTLGRLSGISDIEIQALAGHRSSAMMNHYSHAGQVIDYSDARTRLEGALKGEQSLPSEKPASST